MSRAPDISLLAASAKAMLAQELDGADHGGPTRARLGVLLRAYRSQDRPASYGFEPAAATEIRSEAERYGGTAGLERLNRLFLIKLIAGLEDAAPLRDVPDSILPQLAKLLADILRTASKSRRGVHTLAADRHRKDLAVCLLRMLPVGPELAEVDSGLSRRALVGPSFGELISRSAFVLRRVGGLKPLLVLHLDRRLVTHFSPEGYDDCYARLGHILRVRAAVKGVWSSFSWYLDPALDEVSPELSYLRKVPVSGGAHLFRGQPDDQQTTDATRWSPHRRRLFEEGRYRPVPYSWLWARADLLRHVDRAG